MTRCFIGGKTYPHRDAIKGIEDEQGQRVFRWEPNMKRWETKIPDDAIDELADTVKERCPGCELHVDTDALREEETRGPAPF